MIKHEYGRDYSISFRRININDKELLTQFKCENCAIRDFIQNRSVESDKDVSYVFIDEENNRIMGFCAICCTGISVTDIDSKGKPYLTSLPSVEIDYFAVDEEYRGKKLDASSTRYQTLSQFFFFYILDHIKSISTDYVGATHVCLYAVPKAESFYKRCGLDNFAEYMNKDEIPFLEGCVPMFCKIDK